MNMEEEKMKLSGIFKFLITAVVCIAIGAFIVTVVMPNVVNSTVNTVENGIHNSVGIDFDVNGDSQTGQLSGVQNSAGDTASQGIQGVQGFTGSEAKG